MKQKEVMEVNINTIPNNSTMDEVVSKIGDVCNNILSEKNRLNDMLIEKGVASGECGLSELIDHVNSLPPVGHTHPTTDIIGFASHGNHLPTYEGANNLRYLRCDGSWQTIPSASTSVKGVVQLSNSYSSTSSTYGATSYAVKQAYDRASKVQLPTSKPSSVSTGMMWIE